MLPGTAGSLAGWQTHGHTAQGSSGGTAGGRTVLMDCGAGGGKNKTSPYYTSIHQYFGGLETETHP